MWRPTYEPHAQAPHLYRPVDAEYEKACENWALAAHLRPAAVAFPRSPAEAAVVIRLATAEGLRVAPLGTGHNAYPFTNLSNTVLVRTDHLNSYQLDRDAGVTRIGAGAIWGPLVDMLSVHGLAALHGSSPDAGIIGYTLGGGIGWYGRALGLAANTVAAVDLITADGSLVRADEYHEADLFWALRGGGGGNFGLVTAIEMRLENIRTAYAGMLAWDLREAERVLPRWVEWAETATDAVTTAYRQLQFPLIPSLPEQLRGRQLVVIDGAALADDIEAEQILAPLRALRPKLDTFRRVPVRSLVRLHNDQSGSMRSALLTELPAAGIDQLLEASGPDSDDAVVTNVELRQLGGALRRPAAAGGVLNRIDEPFLLLSDGWDVSGAMTPWTSSRNYLNFCQQPVDPSTGFDPGAWQTLLQVRRRIDPFGIFRANHEIPV
jgi:FAD/FMN-containing dehydrogenase